MPPEERTDIFEFWKDVGPETKIHPEDEPFLKGLTAKHNLCLDCLPVPFYGPLQTAKIVLLYLNPGLGEADLDAANNMDEQQFYWRQRQGREPLRSQINLAKKSWWVSRTKRISPDTEFLRHQLAVLELCPYHSKSFKDGKLLKALPSSRVALNWARNVLFPQARDKAKVVICLRSAKRWGLEVGTAEGFLFSPKTNQSGYMWKNGRDTVVQTAQEMLGIQPSV